jgi:hypothetical protein
MVLHRAWMNTLRLREREQRERARVQGVILGVVPQGTGLRQLAVSELVVFSKARTLRHIKDGQN